MTQDGKSVEAAHIIFEDEGRLLYLVAEFQDINLGENTASTVQEQAPDQDQCVEDTKEGEKRGKRSKREAPNSGHRGSRRLKQRPRRNYSDMVFGNAADSDAETSLASAFSAELEEVFCMIEITGDIFTRPRESSSVKEALEGLKSDRWKESMAEELNGL